MSRELLHVKDLEAFKTWLTAEGIEHRDGRGIYQVIQIYWAQGWRVIYERENTHAGKALVHYTVPFELTGLVRRFIHQKKAAINHTGDTQKTS